MKTVVEAELRGWIENYMGLYTHETIPTEEICPQILWLLI